jgi:hypothetical protein
MKKKGTPKTGGREKGTPNKVTSDLRAWIALLIENNREQLESDLEALEPKERWQLIEKLMQYVIPKKQQDETLQENSAQSELIKRLFGKTDD